MDPRYEARRLGDVGNALRMARTLAAQERLPRERLAVVQQGALGRLVGHARSRSPYYRERIGGGPVALERLPVLDKATLMERFDDVVCDRRLRRDMLLEHLGGLDRDALLLGEYRVMTTSGSSGRKGLYVYDRAGWAVICAQLLRYNDWTGLRPKLPRLKIAAIGGGAPTHMTRRVADTMAVGLHRMLRLAVTMPVAELVGHLNAFRPHALNTYPSMALLLADEQRAGRLRLSLKVLSTSSELRTPEMTAAIEDAFGVRAYDLYGTTEGLWGASCGHGAGHHLFEDVTLVENVDEEGRPVPPGERGARLLVTNLHNFVLPLIRFEVSDVVTLDPEPCPCGRTLRVMRAVDGRADAVLRLPGRAGERVAVHPLQFGALTADPAVREFQVRQRGDGLRILVALREGEPEDLVTERLRERLGARLAALGVREPAVAVEVCDGIERPPAGKLQLVVADGVLETVT
jgi:phenylacetate-coenzyme A ligase PaaK-like adenylate-forming protein